MDILKVYCDGGSRGNPGPAASGFVVKDAKDTVLFVDGRRIGIATNNVAEYTAVKIALEWITLSRPNASLHFFLDSLLVVNQLNGFFKIKNEQLHRYVLSIKQLEKNVLGEITYQHIPREKNKEADALVNRALDNLPIPA